MIPKAAYVIHGHFCSGVGRIGEFALSAEVSVVPGPVPTCGAAWSSVTSLAAMRTSARTRGTTVHFHAGLSSDNVNLVQLACPLEPVEVADIVS